MPLKCPELSLDFSLMDQVGISISRTGRFVWVVFWVEQNSMSQYWKRQNINQQEDDKDALLLSNLSFLLSFIQPYIQKHLFGGKNISYYVPSKDKSLVRGSR